MYYLLLFHFVIHEYCYFPQNELTFTPSAASPDIIDSDSISSMYSLGEFKIPEVNLTINIASVFAGVSG